MEPTREEINRLRGCINDLISIVGLSAIWSGRESAQIVSILLDALLTTLRLDFAYARFEDPIGAAPVEMVRFSQADNRPPRPQEMGELLNGWWGADHRKWPLHARKAKTFRSRP
jgi:hypothetical protein